MAQAMAALYSACPSIQVFPAALSGLNWIVFQPLPGHYVPDRVLHFLAVSL